MLDANDNCEKNTVHSKSMTKWQWCVCVCSSRHTDSHQIQLEYQLRESGWCALHARLSLQFIMSQPEERRWRWRRLRLNVSCNERKMRRTNRMWKENARSKLVYFFFSFRIPNAAYHFACGVFFFFVPYYTFFSPFLFPYSCRSSVARFLFPLVNTRLNAEMHLFMSQLFIVWALSLLCWLHINYIYACASSPPSLPFDFTQVTPVSRNADWTTKPRIYPFIA